MLRLACVVLWFAFNFWSNDLWHQLWGWDYLQQPRCDLLSTFDRTIFDINLIVLQFHHPEVVICFQLLIERSLTSTLKEWEQMLIALWFAFNFWSNDLWHQLIAFAFVKVYVVICFQLLIERSLTSTSKEIAKMYLLLWFAFNFWSNDLWHQPTNPVLTLVLRCDLLSTFDRTIFDINYRNVGYNEYSVVICFQLLIERSLTSTLPAKACYLFMLWFAFNFWSNDLWHQLVNRCGW